MEQIGLKLRVTFYDASDGPRIVIFGPTNADFYKLRELLKNLSNTPGRSCSLEVQPFVVAFQGIRVSLTCSAGTPAELDGIRRIGGHVSPEFQWQKNSEGWDHLVKLIDSLNAASYACHQYLTTYPVEDDVIVVISKGEYDDTVIDI